MRKEINNIFLAILTVFLCLIFIGDAGADYEDVVLADNPLLYFRFEDLVMPPIPPDVNDIGSLGKGGTFRGDSVGYVPSAPCIGQAAYFQQAGSEIDLIYINDSDGGLSLQDVTYEMWFQCDGDITTWSRLFSHNSDIDEEGAPEVMMNSYNQTPPNGEFGIYGGDSVDYTGVGTGPTDDGNWHHVVVTYDSSDSNVVKELYLDGQLKGSYIGPSALSYDSPYLLIGADGVPSYAFNELRGAVDEVAIYEGVLSANRILLHYTAGIGCSGDCWSDNDNDDWLNCHDNCPDVYNPGQADCDGDNIGDECECETANLDDIDPVNFKDFAILAEDWWDTGPGDTNRDGIVDMEDLLQVVEHWLENCVPP